MRICFRCPMAQPVFEPHVTSPFGGSEVRAFHFATGLAARGHDVHVLTETHGATGARVVHNVCLHYDRLPKPLVRSRDFQSAWDYLRLWPEMTARRSFRSFRKAVARRATDGPRMVRSLASIPADVYACLGVHRHAADVIHTASLVGKPSLLLLASDTDLDVAYSRHGTTQNHYGQPAHLCAETLARADLIVAQTAAQQAMLYERFGRVASVVRNPLALPPSSDASRNGRTKILWIGRADTFSKRADLALELARRCPRLPFHLVLNRRDPRVFESLIRDLPANVVVTEYVPYREIDDLFRSARCLLNTSDAEGFPNTFLQAAAHAVPIVSLRVDPDQMLTTHGCGCVLDGDFDRMARQLHAWSQDTPDFRRAVAAGPQFVARYHDRDARCRELEQLMQNLVDGFAAGVPPRVADEVLSRKSGRSRAA